mmetsp:Transcript_19017/g.33889  ORF Transcript_19017/g.33889 Transcript_19017/m.33889 type:complete len:366 (+) Transcript_19017:525-1622(+)
MAHADAKHGLLAQNFLRVLHSVGHRRGVTGAIAEEDAVGVHRQHLRGGRGGGHHGHFAPKGRQATEDVGLDAKVVRHDLELLALATLGPAGLGLEHEAGLPLGVGGFSPLVRFLAGHLRNEVLAHDGPLLGLGDQVGGGGGEVGGDDTVEAAGVAQAAGDLAGVYSRDARHTLLLQVCIQGGLRPVVGDHERVVTDHNAGEVHRVGLHVLVVDAGVADVGVGEGNELALVGGVGQDLLVAGEGGVEDHLRQLRPFRAKVVPHKLGAVLHHQSAVILFPRATGSRDDRAAATTLRPQPLRDLATSYRGGGAGERGGGGVGGCGDGGARRSSRGDGARGPAGCDGGRRVNGGRDGSLGSSHATMLRE